MPDPEFNAVGRVRNEDPDAMPYDATNVCVWTQEYPGRSRLKAGCVGVGVTRDAAGVASVEWFQVDHDETVAWDGRTFTRGVADA